MLSRDGAEIGKRCGLWLVVEEWAIYIDSGDGSGDGSGWQSVLGQLIHLF